MSSRAREPLVPAAGFRLRPTLSPMMRNALAAFAALLLIAAIILGYRATLEDSQAPRSEEQRRIQRAADANEGSLTFDTLDHKEENETFFDRSVFYLAPTAPAPLINRALVEGFDPDPGPVVVVVPEEEKRWSGVVLVPTDTVVSRAFTALVDIPRIEAHPQTDRRMRIWARIVNPTTQTLRVGVACTFRSTGQREPYSRGFDNLVLPPRRYRDVAFISPLADVESYTILVKRY